MILHLDFETRSVLDLEIYGTDNYARHPSTTVLLAAYAFDDHRPKLWQPHLSPEIPNDLREALLDPFVEVHAWNAQFERAICKYVLGVDKPVQEFRDPMIMSRYLSLPGSLEESGKVLKLRSSEAKQDGDRLIKLFCEPEDVGGELTLFGISAPTFRDWRTDPGGWELFCKYCLQDVVAERAIEKKLLKFPLPDFEWETWFLSEKINETGWPTDPGLNAGAKVIVEKSLAPLHEEAKALSGCDNPNSRDQILAFLSTQGYTFTSLKKDFVARALGGECDLTADARRVLEIRGQTAKSSVSKYTAISDLSGPDNRLRYEYQFMGASRTHRWSALGVNVGNLPRPTKQVENNLDRAIELVREMDYGGIVREFGKPLEVVSSILRSSFVAPPGKQFVVADLASIENRCLGFLARCPAILNVFTTMFTYNGPDYPEKGIYNGQSFPMDPYLEFATRLYGESYESMWIDWKIKGDSSKRTMAKPASLGAGYSLGVGKEERDDDGNLIRTGLLGYAAAMHVEMTPEESAYAIRIFRESYREVPVFWKDMNKAAVRAIRHPGELTGVGLPYTENDQEYFASIGRKPNPPLLYFKCHGAKVLELMLPSGRSIHYINPEARDEPASFTDPKTGRIREYTRSNVYYEGKEQKSKQWGQVSTHGGKLCENACQSVSRDVLVHGMKKADEAGFEIVGHSYDEIITLVPVGSDLTVEKLCECMTDPPAWCGTDLPLSAEGFNSEYYRKN